MAIGRIGTTPTLRTRWSKQPSAGTTSLSGLDDNSVSLVYDVGYEAVYRNGVLLSRGNDYTATSGTSITLIDATIAGDVIEVFANQSIPLTDTYTQTVADGKFINNTLVDAKGDILTATADNTPARLAVGSNDQVLTADSSTATGLKWATPAAGGMTLLSTTSLSGATTTISSIPGTYTDLRIVIFGVTNATSSSNFVIKPNGSTTNAYQSGINPPSNASSVGNDEIKPCLRNIKFDNANNAFAITIFDYANTTRYKTFLSSAIYQASDNTTQGTLSGGGINTNSAITSLGFSNEDFNLSTGTVLLYGVK